MLNAFIGWARRMQRDCAGKSVRAHITTREHAGNPSARITFETPLAFARLSYWQSRDFVAEIITRDTANTLFLEHGQIEPGQDLYFTFAPFIEALGVGLKSEASPTPPPRPPIAPHPVPGAPHTPGGPAHQP